MTKKCIGNLFVWEMWNDGSTTHKKPFSVVALCFNESGYEPLNLEIESQTTHGHMVLIPSLLKASKEKRDACVIFYTWFSLCSLQVSQANSLNNFLSLYLIEKYQKQVPLLLNIFR